MSSDRRVHQTTDAAEALEGVEAFLAADPVGHNVVLSILAERARDPEPGTYWWVTAGGTVEGVALQSPPGGPASITPMGSPALDALVPAMAAAVADLPGVLAEAATAAGFAGRWSEQRGVGAEPVEGERLYRLGQLRPPADVDGRLRLARPDELATILEYWRGLADDTGIPGPTGDGPALIARRIAQHEIWIWEAAGVAASMLRLSAPAAGTVRVGFVYTPPVHRRHGFASASVAAASARAREAGARELVLYTQLANPTSNGIYRRLGYEAVAEVLSYRFLT